MEIKSLTDCLNKIDNMIFDKTLKFMLKDNLELIRNYIVSHQADEDKFAFLSALSQINQIYSIDIEEELDKQYNNLRHKILYWYDTKA